MDPSVADGGDAPFLAHENIGSALLAAARVQTGSMVFIDSAGARESLSYADLLFHSRKVLNGLRSRGVAVGDLVLLQAEEERELLAGFWACVLGGFVPVPVTAGTSSAQRTDADRLLVDVWRMLDQPWVLTGHETDGDAAPPWAARWLGSIARLAEHEPADRLHEAAPDDLAVLLLTSGSTGLPKAVMLRHGNILSRSVATAEVNGLTAETRTFNWMPLDHVGGLIMFHARDVVLGCHQVHARLPWILADPLRWLAAMSAHGSEVTWAPNFAFGLVNDRAVALAGRDWDLRALRYIMNGGEPVKPRVARTFLRLLSEYGLPATAMYPGWGMSETTAGVVDCVFSPEQVEEDARYVPVGRPHPGVRLRVVDEDDRVVPQGTVGRLQAAGPTIFAGYYGNPEQTAAAFTEDGWFRTGDLAYLDDGTLVVTGRVDDVLVLDGIYLHGHEIEAAVEELAAVEPSYTVASTVRERPENPHRLAVFLHPRDSADVGALAADVRSLVHRRFGVEVAHVVPVAREDVPKTGIGKLRRAHLRRRFEAGAIVSS
ncbi:AMP-binding protein [Micromonospora endophytica]|uniref:Uncharacterized protein n=2 Tax=Micromonospora endophytica TaxID=515350 RepID=A0A2W2D658_9ACTN|nr:AMP-binding protein [Micromonospora endophytica]PZF99198.1 hypothetical protein C1I93_06485 [Micromonospora endophytica]RIW45073.1 hypothetical protein D3H59_16410 [Micromonospora endophytica]BCJ58046.1 hypothetical protein Jiend_14680 [Micromonospora endophytica]